MGDRKGSYAVRFPYETCLLILGFGANEIRVLIRLKVQRNMMVQFQEKARRWLSGTLSAPYCLWPYARPPPRRVPPTSASNPDTEHRRLLFAILTCLFCLSSRDLLAPPHVFAVCFGGEQQQRAAEEPQQREHLVVLPRKSLAIPLIDTFVHFLTGSNDISLKENDPERLPIVLNRSRIGMGGGNFINARLLYLLRDADCHGQSTS